MKQMQPDMKHIILTNVNVKVYNIVDHLRFAR